MPLFTVSRGQHAINTANDSLTIVSVSNKPLRIYTCKVGGANNVPNFNEIWLQRSTGGTTPGGAVTPEKVDVNSSAACFSVYTTWANQPALSGGPLHRFTVNSNGGIDPMIKMPGFEIQVPAGGQVSIRAGVVNGSSNGVLNLDIEEIG